MKIQGTRVSTHSVARIVKKACTATALVTALLPVGAGAITVQVGADASCDFDNLQDAINAVEAVSETRLITVHDDLDDVSALITKSMTVAGGHGPCAAPFPVNQRETLNVEYGHAGIRIEAGNSGRVDVVLKNLQINSGDGHNPSGVGLTTYGGGLYITGSAAEVTLQNVTVKNSKAYYGGGIYLADGDLTIKSDGQIDDNHAYENGGGIYCYNGDITIDNTDFYSNSATNGGGGAYLNDCFMRVGDGNSIRHNITSSGPGGGLSLNGGSSLRRTFAYTDSLFTIVSNRADDPTYGRGGGISLSNSSMNLTNTEILYNSAGVHGGGLRLTSASYAYMDSTLNCQATDSCSRIYSNQSEGDGGGVAVTIGEISFERVDIQYNDASGVGGAIYGTTADITLKSTLITDNDSNTVIYTKGGAQNFLRVYFSTIADNWQVADNSIWVEAFTGQTPQISLIGNIIWEDTNANPLNKGILPAVVDCLFTHDIVQGTNVVVNSLAPGFVDGIGNDYHLSSDSPAIDICPAPALAIIPTDMDDEFRGVDHPGSLSNGNNHYDAGVDEYGGRSIIILNDGFESGNLNSWSQVIGEGTH